LELITDIPGLSISGETIQTIRGLTSDSRDVRTGWLFAAFPGTKQDGRAFIAEAITHGAVAVLIPEGTEFSAPPSVTCLTAKNPRSAFAYIAAAFYGRQMGTIAAVTGTNGKSSTVHFCRQIWQTMDHASACLGTLGIVANLENGGGINRPGSLTTPDPVTLYSEIAELEAAGVTHLALEASSQGLDQFRLDGLRVTTAGFTNLTRDHLDYHGTMEKYFESKMRLFREVLIAGGVAVVNDDSDYAQVVRKVCAERALTVIGYGEKGTDIRLEKRKPLQNGQFIALNVFGERYELELGLVGDFQASNALCALSLVLAADPGNKALHMQGVQALERLQSVRGRLECAASTPGGGVIYVDYAHTPDGLGTMLKALRPHTQRKLHVVFGCGGDRDRGKRPLMGEIATRLADHVIVTDDNPRTEDPAAVRAEIIKAAPGAIEIASRKEAIHTAIRTLEPGDILVIAGKGHEQGQIVGANILPFDDVTEAKTAVWEMTQ
jgi:UDP-N-acetylmuramoyl-L-alanyl-D-glutamate--2,6-diaminopimelate ligase